MHIRDPPSAYHSPAGAKHANDTGMKETAFKHVHDIKEAVGSQVAKHADVPM